MSLQEVIDLIPHGIPIELLKVDAQGVDLIVVQSAGNHMARLQKVIIEAQTVKGDGSNLLSKDSALKKESKAWFAANGFAYDGAASYEENPEIGEWNLVFDRIH